jgi:nitroimidazol reductase NimA-like FMN-containing flavoprotein (pyridoxamine 5'-phosphate oxidase superfamily)
MSETRASIPEDINRHIEGTYRTFMVTRRKDGSPTCHPMARFYADGRYYLNMYSTSIKHKNLQRDPRICCLVTSASDDPDFRAVVYGGTARYLPPDETLSEDAPTAVRMARGINMEGVKSEDDAPEKFKNEDPTDLLKRAAIMRQRIRDGVRVLWEVVPDRVAWLTDVRGR